MKSNSQQLIYGISSKFEFDQWYHGIVVFDDQEKANAWLQTEEYDSRERELFHSENKAIRLLGKGGKKKLAEARDYYGF